MRLRPETLLMTAACLLAPLAACAESGVRPAPPETAERRLTAVKAEMMTADYRADLARLASLRDAVAPLTADPSWGYLAHYWAGFASWRVAINGASKGMSQEDLRANLERASADFEASIRLRDDFADSYAAAAGVDGWLPLFHSGDTAAIRAFIEQFQRLIARAKELAPDNPRVLWVDAVPYLYLPVEKGGNPARAVEIYRRMVEVSGPLVPSSPLPDWGKPEGLMSLAFAHLNQVPDLASAEKEARAALHLQPEWSYVKDILLPQIEKARAADGAKPPGR
jgi:hypothetical protein